MRGGLNNSRRRSSRDLGDDAVSGGDALALVAVGRRDELLGEQQRLAVPTQHRLDVADVRHVHRELVQLVSRRRARRRRRGGLGRGGLDVPLEVDQRAGRAQPLTRRPQTPVPTNISPTSKP